jgi:hypothetical protein
VKFGAFAELLQKERPVSHLPETEALKDKIEVFAAKLADEWQNAVYASAAGQDLTPDDNLSSDF